MAIVNAPVAVICAVEVGVMVIISNRSYYANYLLELIAITCFRCSPLFIEDI